MKKIVIELDTVTGDFNVDIEGGQDSSCAAIQRAFDDLGEVTKDLRKPEFYRQNINLQRK